MKRELKMAGLLATLALTALLGAGGEKPQEFVDKHLLVVGNGARHGLSPALMGCPEVSFVDSVSTSTWSGFARKTPRSWPARMPRRNR